MAIGLITYQDTARAEDVVPVVTNVSPSETPLLSGLSESTATQTLHEYLEDTLSAGSDNAAAEAADFTVTDLTAPTRKNNIVQMFLTNIQVSSTETLVKTHYGDPLEYQIAKMMKKHALDIELALMAGSRASGASGSPRRMDGVINSITTNATTRASGSSLGEDIYNDIMEMIYNQTDEVADEVYVGATLKRDISGFTAGATKFLEVEDRRLIRNVAVYEGDFGIQKIFLHRYVPNGANAKMLVAIRNEYWKIAWLQRTQVYRLPLESATRRRAQILSELTLEARAEKTSAAVGGFTS